MCDACALCADTANLDPNDADGLMYRIPFPRLISQRLSSGLLRRNFGRWYQDMMMESHFHLVTALLLTIAVMAMVELVFDQSASSFSRIGWLALLSGAMLLTINALHRYFFFMMWAEQVANQASCARCGTYGRFRLVRESGHHCDVACKRCAFEWSIEEPTDD